MVKQTTCVEKKRREAAAEERRKKDDHREFEWKQFRRDVLKIDYAMNCAKLEIKLADEEKEKLAMAALKMFYVIAHTPSNHPLINERGQFYDDFELEESLFNEDRLYKALGKEDARTVLAVMGNYRKLMQAALPLIEQYVKEPATEGWSQSPQRTFFDAMR